MIRFLCSRVFYKQNGLLFNGDSTTLFLIRSISAFASNNPTTHPNSLTVSYLIDSCGLPEEKAISASKKIQLKTSAQPDSVLNLFRNHDFSNTHISKIIQKLPSLLLSKPDKTLNPKLEYFKSIGFSGPDLANLLSADPYILMQSLENRLIPSIAFLKTIVGTESNVTTVCKRSPRVLQQDPQKRLAPNIAILRNHGVPDGNISKLLVFSARPLLRTNGLNQIVEEVKKMEFDPLKSSFVKAIHVFSSLSKSSLERRIDIYKKWGWSKEEIHAAFRYQPECLRLSENNIMATMEFLVNRMGYDPSVIAKYPLILMFSLEKRIIPRLSVIQVLTSSGFVKKKHHIGTFLILSEKDFLNKYVTKFVEKVPELVNVYTIDGRKMSAL